MAKTKKITNKHYRAFIEEGVIEIITEDHIKKALENIKGKNMLQSRSLLIIMYYSGARPIEVLGLKARDVKKNGKYYSIFFPSSKGGLARTLEFKTTPLMNEVWKYRERFQDDVLLFWNYISPSKKRKRLKNGTIRITDNPTNRLTHHVKKWFKGVLEDPIPPYYLRHSRISQLAMTGAVSEEQLRVWKGSRSAESVRPYTHLTARTLRKITRVLK